MRTNIIPAQITTVEDKIAGSLNMTQILLLLSPVLWTALVYILLPIPMKLTGYKVPLIVIASIGFTILAIRIRGKIILEWLSVLITYRLRPKVYVFNKNSLYERQIDLPEINNQVQITKSVKISKKSKSSDALSVTDLVKLETLMNSGKLAVSFNFKENQR
jgi:hypothetical protein